MENNEASNSFEEEPETVSVSDLSQNLQLTKQVIEQKLLDPDELPKFTFVTHTELQNSIWNKFNIISYCGQQQNYVKCSTCNAIFDNDPPHATKLLQNHTCLILDIDESNDDPMVEMEEGDPLVLSKTQLQMVLADETEKDNIKIRPKKAFKCFAWEFLDMIFYKEVKQAFAICRYCRALVAFKNKNGTSSIRKHVTRCSAIPKTDKFPSQESQDEKNDDDCNIIEDEPAEDGEEPFDMLIPEVVYDNSNSSSPFHNNTTLDSRNDDDSDNDFLLEVMSSTGSSSQIYDKFKLQELFSDPSEREHFVFEKPRKNDDAAYWQIFEYVIYRGVRQNYCRCNQCGVYINFVSTRRRGLARHMRSCNRKFVKKVPAAVVSTPKKPVKAEPMKKQPIVKASTPVPKKVASVTPSTSTQILLTPQLAAALQSPSPVPHNSKQSKPSIPPDFKNQLILNQLSFIATDLQSLDFIESDNFRNFAQNLITLGAEYGPHKIDEILTTKETLLKYMIPTKLSKVRKHIRELLSGETHLNLSVDLYENTSYDKMNFRYYLTVTCHILTQFFDYKSITLGTKEFQDSLIAEDITRAFLKIISEYYDTENMEAHCYIVTDDENELLVKAFEKYTRLPSITHKLRSIFNDMLLCNDISPDIVDNVKKIQKLFLYLRTNYNYHSNSSGSVIEQIEEFYELLETIKKILKEKNDTHRLLEISKHTVKTVINFVELIKLCLDTLNDNLVTIHGVLLWKRKLAEHYTPALHEHKLIDNLKKKTIALIDTKFDTSHEFYKVALFLNPAFKSMKFLTPDERESIHALVKQMVDELNNDIDDCIEVSQPPKRLRVDEVFAGFLDTPPKPVRNHSTNNSDGIESEISQYANEKFFVTCQDPVEFWGKSHQFPGLRRLARKILSIPTCSRGVSETTLLKANRAYREVYGKSVTIDEFNSIIFLNRNFEIVENID